MNIAKKIAGLGVQIVICVFIVTIGAWIIAAGWSNRIDRWKTCKTKGHGVAFCVVNEIWYQQEW